MQDFLSLCVWIKYKYTHFSCHHPLIMAALNRLLLSHQLHFPLPTTLFLHQFSCIVVPTMNHVPSGCLCFIMDPLFCHAQLMLLFSWGYVQYMIQEGCCCILPEASIGQLHQHGKGILIQLLFFLFWHKPALAPMTPAQIMLFSWWLQQLASLLCFTLWPIQ